MLVQKALDNTEKDFGLGTTSAADQVANETPNMPYLTNAKKHVNLD